jgi:hypothetical protein
VRGELELRSSRPSPKRTNSGPEPVLWGTVSLWLMGRFVTRIRPGDRELQERIVAEARRCLESSTPTSQAVERLVVLAGDNQLAFGGGTGRSQRDLARTDEGRAVLKLLALAFMTRERQTRVGVRPFSFHRRTPEEDALVHMPIAEAFDLLAQEEPRLRVAEAETTDAATKARQAGDGDAGVRAAVGEVVARTVVHDPLVGRSARDQSGLCASRSAVLVVTEHLYAVAGLSPIDLD